MVVLVKAMRVMLNRGMRIKFVLKDVRFILNAHFYLRFFIVLLILRLVKCDS
jgi:hypothetical protein